MTKKQLENLYFGLEELEQNYMLLNWSGDDIKMLNNTRLKIFQTIQEEFYPDEDLATVKKIMYSKRFGK